MEGGTFLSRPPSTPTSRPSHSSAEPMAGAGGGAAAVPAALPAAATRFSLPPAGGQPLGPLDDDVYLVARDSPMIDSLSFLSWDKSPQAPAPYKVARFQVQALFVELLRRDANAATLATLRRSNFLEHGPTHTFCTTAAKEVGRHQIFSTKFATRSSFAKAVHAEPNMDWSQLLMAGNDLAALETGDGEAELDFLRLLTWDQLLSAAAKCFGDDHAGVPAARLLLALGSKARNTTRQDASSMVRIAAETLSGFVKAFGELGDGVGAATYARHLCKFVVDALEALDERLQLQHAQQAAARARRGSLLRSHRQHDLLALLPHWPRVRAARGQLPRRSHSTHLQVEVQGEPPGVCTGGYHQKHRVAPQGRGGGLRRRAHGQPLRTGQ